MQILKTKHKKVDKSTSTPPSPSLMRGTCSLFCAKLGTQYIFLTNLCASLVECSIESTENFPIGQKNRKVSAFTQKLSCPFIRSTFNPLHDFYFLIVTVFFCPLFFINFLYFVNFAAGTLITAFL